MEVVNGLDDDEDGWIDGDDPNCMIQGQETDVVEGEQTIALVNLLQSEWADETDNNGDGEIDSLDDGCSMDNTEDVIEGILERTQSTVKMVSITMRWID